MITLKTLNKLHTFDDDYKFITIGRDVSKFICEKGMSYYKVGDFCTSRIHCEIEKTNKGYIIRDMESTNGTYINGTRLTDIKRLNNKDFITIGNTHIKCEIESFF